MADPREILNERKMLYREHKRRNYENVKKCFMRAYETDNDPHQPTPWQEVFAGTGLIDIRVPGQSLEEKWPHYFRIVFKENSPRWKDYMPNSPLFQKECDEVTTIIKNIKAVGDEWDRRSREILKSMC